MTLKFSSIFKHKHSSSLRKIKINDLAIFGGQINVFTKIIDWARREAKQRLREDILEAGFDEVINLRLETATITRARGGKDKTSGIEIVAYGTAIKY